MDSGNLWSERPSQASHLQNRISDLMKKGGGRGDPITVGVSFTLQFEEFPPHLQLAGAASPRDTVRLGCL